MSRNNKILLGCGLLVVVFLCGGLVFASGYGIVNLVSDRLAAPDYDVAVRVDPASVYPGETMELLVTIRNQGSREMIVESVTLPADLLAGVVLRRVEPAATGQAGSGEYVFDFPLAPGNSLEIVFELAGVEPGRYLGNLAVQAENSSLEVPVQASILDARAFLQPSPSTSASPSPTSGPVLGAIPFPAVVQIFAMVREGDQLDTGWSGSGSLISADGLILTNAHVVLPDKYYTIEELQVGLTERDDQPPLRRYIAQVLQADPLLDIAVIKIISDLEGNPVDEGALDLPFVPLGDSDALRLGDAITILGYPGIGGETITLTRGEVSGFTSESGRGDRSFIKTSATIAGGNSGGLAANASGELIGVPTQLGYGGEDEFVDCRVLADTNRDGVIDELDNCVPTGGFINALRPISLAIPLIEAARRGEVMIGSQQSEQAEIPLEGEILFEDTFSNPQSGWDVGGDDSTNRSYTDGEYTIQVLPDNYYAWSNPGRSFGDVVISVDARAIQSTGTGDFGLICRYRDEENFYALEISEDGYFAIWKAEEGEFYDLVEWTYSSRIPQTTDVRVAASCTGDLLVLSVDDIILAEVRDNAHLDGDVGLIAGTWDEGDLIMAFDNYVVRGTE